MTIDEAIKIKLQWRKDNYPPALAAEMNADMMSIEALKNVKNRRKGVYIVKKYRLPGETKELPRRGLPLKGIIVKTEKGDQ